MARVLACFSSASCLLLIGLVDIATASIPSFQAIPAPGPPGPGFTQASGISSDGTSFAGQGFINTAATNAYRWRDGLGITVIPSSLGGLDLGNATSSDGTFVVGQFDGGTNVGFRWSQGTGAQSLGTLPGGGAGNSSGMGITGDGSMVVGWSDAGAGLQFAITWTLGGGMVNLGDLPGGTSASRANAVTPDGSTIVGFGTSASGKEAMRYVGGVMSGLGDLPGGTFSSEAKAVSGSGNVIVGNSISASGTEAFLWNGGMIGLGDLAGGTFSSDALSVSGDGSLVVGRARNAGGNAAFIWDSVNGMRNLQTYLSVDLGLDLQGMTLRNATGISADGTVIVGNGENASGVQTAWRAVIPEPSSLSLLLVGAALLNRRSRNA